MQNNPYSIQDFVIRTLESFGALVEQKEYALAEVLVPDVLAQRFNGKNMLLLAFDYEVAQENESSEFVTFGSYILDEVTHLALSKGRTMECFIPVERLEVPSKIEELVQEAVYFVKCRPPQVKNQYIMEHCYYRFNFHCAYQCDEKQEEILPVLVDMNTGRQDEEVQQLLLEIERGLPLQKRQYVLPMVPMIADKDAYTLACAAAKPRIAESMEKVNRSIAVLQNQEMSKVTRFYKNTIDDLERRLSRSQDINRMERLKKQIDAAKADEKRRILDVKEKYSVQAVVALDSIVAYRLPNIHLTLEIQQKDEFFEFGVVFNNLSRKVETPLCPRCGRPAAQLMRDNGELHCGCK